MNSSDLRSPDAESRRQRKLEHKRRRMERLPDHVNHGSAWLRDIRARWRAAILRIGKDLRPLFDGILVRYAAFDDTGFPDPEYFPWVKELEAKTDVIRSELDRILAVREAHKRLGGNPASVPKPLV